MGLHESLGGHERARAVRDDGDVRAGLLVRRAARAPRARVRGRRDGRVLGVPHRDEQPPDDDPAAHPRRQGQVRLRRARRPGRIDNRGRAQERECDTRGKEADAPAQDPPAPVRGRARAARGVLRVPRAPAPARALRRLALPPRGRDDVRRRRLRVREVDRRRAPAPPLRAHGRCRLARRPGHGVPRRRVGAPPHRRRRAGVRALRHERARQRGHRRDGRDARGGGRGVPRRADARVCKGSAGGVRDAPRHGRRGAERRAAAAARDRARAPAQSQRAHPR